MDRRGVLLTKLTPAQKALLPAYRDKWLAIGLATGPTDYATAEQAISEMYRMAGLTPPSEYLHLPSLFHSVLEAQKRAEQQLNLQIWRQVEQKIWQQIDQQIWEQIWRQIGVQVRQQLWQQIDQQIWQQIDQQMWEQTRQYTWHYGYSLRGIEVLAYYDYLLEVCHIGACRELDLMIQLAQTIGWWWPAKDICIITPHPSVLHRDERGNLHCEDGPALDYDGAWSVYSWHGVSIPRNIIEQPESITVSDISSEKNAEVRRVMIARYGYERYCKDAGAKMLHRDDWGTLWQVENMRIVEVVNSTPEPDGTWKHYWLRVPPTIKTARGAVAWTNYETERTYSPEIQT